LAINAIWDGWVGERIAYLYTYDLRSGKRKRRDEPLTFRPSECTLERRSKKDWAEALYRV